MSMVASLSASMAGEREEIVNGFLEVSLSPFSGSTKVSIGSTRIGWVKYLRVRLCNGTLEPQVILLPPPAPTASGFFLHHPLFRDETITDSIELVADPEETVDVLVGWRPPQSAVNKQCFEHNFFLSVNQEYNIKLMVTSNAILAPTLLKKKPCILQSSAAGSLTRSGKKKVPLPPQLDDLLCVLNYIIFDYDNPESKYVDNELRVRKINTVLWKAKAFIKGSSEFREKAAKMKRVLRNRDLKPHSETIWNLFAANIHPFWITLAFTTLTDLPIVDSSIETLSSFFVQESLVNSCFEILFFIDAFKSSGAVDPIRWKVARNGMATSIDGVATEILSKFDVEDDTIVDLLELFAYSPTEIDCRDWKISNFAQDLRDGAVLARILAILLPSSSHFSKINFAAASSEEKLSNMNLVWEVLAENSFHVVPLIHPKDIVAGDTMKTSELLWSILSQHFIDHSAGKFTQLLEHVGAPVSSSCHLFVSGAIEVLARLTEAICSKYGLPVHNLRESLADGRAFAAITHHFSPQFSIDKVQAIGELIDDHADEENVNYQNFIPMDGSNLEVQRWEMLRNNFLVLNRYLAQLGGIPILIRPGKKGSVTDISWMSDKVSHLFLAMLCQRLCQALDESCAIQQIRRFFTYGLRSRREACIIQAAFRVHTLCKKAASGIVLYRVESSHATVVQAIFRSWLVKTAFSRQVKASVCIQAKVKCFFERLRYTKLRSTTVKVQALWRAKSQARKFSLLKAASSTVHASFASVSTATKASRTIDSMESIQAALVSLIYLQRFQTLEYSSSVIQGFMRGFKTTRGISSNAQSALTIQSYSRVYKQATKIRTDKEVLTILQSGFKTALNSQKARSSIAKVTRVQSLARRNNARNRYTNLKVATSAVHSFIAAYNVSTRTLDSFNDVYSLQANLKAFTTCRTVKSKVSGLRTIQACLKVVLPSNELNIEHYSAVLIQSCARGFLMRAQKNFLERVCQYIQLNMNCVLPSIDAKNEIRHIRNAQACLRTLLPSLQTSEFSDSIMSLQSNVRGRNARRRYREIQSIISTTQAMLSAVMPSLQRSRESALVKIVQSFARTFLTSQSTKEKVSHIVKIQAISRRNSARNAFLSLRKGTLAVQSIINAVAARRNIFNLQSAATLIGATSRGWLVYSRFLNRHHSCVALKAGFQAILASRLASTTLSHVSVVQACVRGRNHVTQAKRAVSSVTAAAAYFRGVASVITVKNNVAKVSVIIAALQAHRAVLTISNLSYASQCVQAGFVSLVQSRSVYFQKECISTIQAGLHAFAELKEYNRCREPRRVARAVALVEKSWIRYKESGGFAKRQSARIKLQRWIRRILPFHEYNMFCQSAHTLQDQFLSRMQEHATTVQLARVLKAQSFARGWIVRKNSEKELKECHLRLVEATRQWTVEKSIHYRTNMALDVLVNGSRLTSLSDALKELQLVTSLLKCCCKDTVDSGAVPILFDLLGTLNRSGPHMDLAELIISIFINLLDESSTREDVFVDEVFDEMLLERTPSYQHAPKVLLKACKLILAASVKIPEFKLVSTICLFKI